MSSQESSESEASRRAILQIWELCLSALLQWDERRVRQWALQFEWQIEDESSPLYHESPVFWVTPLLIPKALADAHSRQFAQLLGAMEAIILEDQHRTGRSLLDEYDWHSVSRRVDAFLRQYGTSLDAARMELDAARVGLTDNWTQ